MSGNVFTRDLLKVVHPLDDVPESQLYRTELGRMHMTSPVRILLMALRAYVAGMLLLLAWRVFALL
jgi:hypothetical protein